MHESGSSTPRVLVLGLGNPLMGDDGFGAASVDAIHGRWMPSSVRATVADDVLQLPAHWRGERQIWLVDTVLGDGIPGRIYHLAHDRVLALKPERPTAHHLDLATALHWLRLANPRMQQVRFRLWGCQPQRILPVAELAPAVAAAAVRVAEEVVEEAVQWDSWAAAQPDQRAGFGSR